MKTRYGKAPPVETHIPRGPGKTPAKAYSAFDFLFAGELRAIA